MYTFSIGLFLLNFKLSNVFHRYDMMTEVLSLTVHSETCTLTPHLRVTSPLPYSRGVAGY